MRYPHDIRIKYCGFGCQNSCGYPRIRMRSSDTPLLINIINVFIHNYQLLLMIRLCLFSLTTKATTYRPTSTTTTSATTLRSTSTAATAILTPSTMQWLIRMKGQCLHLKLKFISFHLKSVLLIGLYRRTISVNTFITTKTSMQVNFGCKKKKKNSLVSRIILLFYFDFATYQLTMKKN